MSQRLMPSVTFLFESTRAIHAARLFDLIQKMEQPGNKALIDDEKKLLISLFSSDGANYSSYARNLIENIVKIREEITLDNKKQQAHPLVKIIKKWKELFDESAAFSNENLKQHELKEKRSYKYHFTPFILDTPFISRGSDRANIDIRGNNPDELFKSLNEQVNRLLKQQSKPTISEDEMEVIILGNPYDKKRFCQTPSIYDDNHGDNIKRIGIIKKRIPLNSNKHEEIEEPKKPQKTEMNSDQPEKKLMPELRDMEPNCSALFDLCNEKEDKANVAASAARFLGLVQKMEQQGDNIMIKKEKKQLMSLLSPNNDHYADTLIGNIVNTRRKIIGNKKQQDHPLIEVIQKWKKAFDDLAASSNEKIKGEISHRPQQQFQKFVLYPPPPYGELRKLITSLRSMIINNSPPEEQQRNYNEFKEFLSGTLKNIQQKDESEAKKHCNFNKWKPWTRICQHTPPPDEVTYSDLVRQIFEQMVQEKPSEKKLEQLIKDVFNSTNEPEKDNYFFQNQ